MALAKAVLKLSLSQFLLFDWSRHSLRPDLLEKTAPRASPVQDAAKRHRRLAPARSVLDSASTVRCCRQVGWLILPDAGGVTAPPGFRLQAGRKSNAVGTQKEIPLPRVGGIPKITRRHRFCPCYCPEFQKTDFATEPARDRRPGLRSGGIDT